MRATLISRETGRQYIINSKQTRIGKDACEVNLQSPAVEKTHAIIEYEDADDSFVIRDLNTPHGTYVNECRVQNSTVRLANGDVIRFGFNGPLFEVKLFNDYGYPPLQSRTHQAWDSTNATSNYNQTTSDTTHLPFLPLTSSHQEPDYNYSSTVTSLPYPPSQAPSQSYVDSRAMGSLAVMPHPPVCARPTSAGPTPRTRPLPTAADIHMMQSPGAWPSSRNLQEITAEEKANEMEQKLLKMGDELSRLASFEAECHRKDGVIVSLRNEIADLKSNMQIKVDSSYREKSSHEDRSSNFYSSHTNSEMLETIMKEKKDLEKKSAHKLSLLQNQIHAKNKEIQRLEDKLEDIMTGKWPKEDPDASTNTIASLKSSMARKDRHIAQLQTDLEKSTKQKSQTASLVNNLQRESATKDNLIHKSRNENDKLRRDIREKDSQISTLSSKLTRQQASKEVEKDFERKEDDIRLLRQKLTNADHQMKEKNSIIRNLQTDVENFKRALDENRQNDITLQKELQNMRIQYVEKERADKSNRVELREQEIKAEKFRKKILSCLFASGISRPNRELTDDDIIKAIRSLSEDSLSLQERTNQLNEVEEQRSNLSKNDERCKRAIERFLDSSEKRLIKYGRRCETLEDVIMNLQDIEVTENLLWLKEVIANVLMQEKAWEQEIEEALEDGGMEADKGKKEPAHLIRKIFEKIKKKKEKISNMKLRLKAIESEHQESLVKFKAKFLQDTEDEVTKAVEKLKRDEQTKIQNLMSEFRKREEIKVAEAVDAERKLFEREFGNLTDLHKQLGQTQLSIDEHKNKSVTFQDQILQLKFSMEKAQQNEIQLKKEIEERDVNHKAQLEAVNKEKAELKQKFIEEVNVFREQSHQYSLTIVALEDRLLKMNKNKKKTEQENYFFRQSKDSNSYTGRSSPKRTVERPASPRKPPKRDASTVTDHAFINPTRHAQGEIERLERLVTVLRKEATEAQRDSSVQGDVIKGLKRDLIGANARLSDMAGELDDTQKQKIEDLKDRIRKQDDELFSQRKQLIDLSNLVEEQKSELIKRDGKLKEQMYVAHVQEERLQDKGKEIVHLLQHQEAEREEQEIAEYQTDKKAYANREITIAGSRCLGDRHDQTINRQKEALIELRQRIKELEMFQPPLPSQRAALQQVSLMKKELVELKSELSLRDEEMMKDETQLQSEARISRELLDSVNQQLAMEKAAQREFREALDASEQTPYLEAKWKPKPLASNIWLQKENNDRSSLNFEYFHLLRSVCSLLDMEAPPSSDTIIHLPKHERDRILNGRNIVLDDVVKKLSTLHERLKRKEKLLGGYENDLTHLRNTEELAGRKSAEALSLTSSVQNKQDEIDCLREALSRVREELDQQKRLNKSISQRKVFKMDLEKQLELEPKAHRCYEDDFKKNKEDMKKRKQTEKMKRKNYEIESLKKELRSADRELNATAAKLYELEAYQPKSSPRRDDNELDTEPVLEELWKHA